jgi:DNA-binding beta-propeller fold protein YncE
MSILSWFRSLLSAHQRTATRSPRPRTSLRAEQLEDRLCPSADYLFVPDFDRHDVLRYNAATGAFVDDFIARKTGGLNQPWSVIVSPHDGNILVSTGHYGGPGQIKAVLRFDGGNGAFIDQFVPHGTLTQIHSITFGPDGNLYVDDRILVDGQRQGRIARFDGWTGDHAVRK